MQEYTSRHLYIYYTWVSRVSLLKGATFTYSTSLIPQTGSPVLPQTKTPTVHVAWSSLVVLYLKTFFIQMLLLFQGMAPFDFYFQDIEKLILQKSISLRVRSLLWDLISTREYYWTPCLRAKQAPVFSREQCDQTGRQVQILI